MKILFLIISICTISNFIKCQTISGYIYDSETNEPLEFASIGILNTSNGSITDETGYFELHLNKFLGDSLVRFSMISYKSQTYKLNKLIENKNRIELENDTICIEEVVINGTGQAIMAGAPKFNKIGSLCGWGGNEFGSGNEIGIKIELDNSFYKLKNLNIHVHRQSYDTSLFRLHIRTISDSIPSKELLTENIFIPISIESGWFQFDLSDYNIVLNGEIALSLEWVKVYGINKDRTMKISKIEQENYVLFNTKRQKGFTYTRWGTEAKWQKHKNLCPSMYLTLLK